MDYVAEANKTILELRDEAHLIGKEIVQKLYPELKKAIANEDYDTIQEINDRALQLRELCIEKQAKAESLLAILRAMGYN